MSSSKKTESGEVLGTDTKITLLFVVFAVVLWVGVGTVTESRPLQFAVLAGVGIIAPTLVNEIRS